MMRFERLGDDKNPGKRSKRLPELQNKWIFLASCPWKASFVHGPLEKGHLFGVGGGPKMAAISTAEKSWPH
jgi:hypothetical protein